MMKKFKPPILVSYAYMKNGMAEVLAKYSGKIRIFIDSGAFTAHKQGKQIDLDEYCSFVKNPPFELERYFMLDVIGDPTATKKNLDRMLKKNMNPIPVFTRGEDLKNIPDFYKVSDLVALGGIANTNNCREYVKWVMPHFEKRNVHWLGFSMDDFLRHYKPYSCDSISWCRVSRFAIIHLWMNNSMKILTKNQYLKQYKKLPFQQSVKRLGFNLYDTLKEENWKGGYPMMQKLSTASTLKYAERLLLQNGTSYFLVCSSKTDVEHIMEVYNGK